MKQLRLRKNNSYQLKFKTKGFMKRIFSVSHNTKNIDSFLLIIRVSIALLMLTHGIPKLMNLINGEITKFPDVLGMGSELSLILDVFAEVFCSVLILTGFGTRLAVIPLIITMLTASLIIHSSDPFAVKELSLHYLLVYVMLLIAGSGRYSVDGFLTANKVLRQGKRINHNYQSLSNEKI